MVLENMRQIEIIASKIYLRQIKSFGLNITNIQYVPYKIDSVGIDLTLNFRCMLHWNHWQCLFLHFTIVFFILVGSLQKGVGRRFVSRRRSWSSVGRAGLQLWIFGSRANRLEKRIVR
jgi:hypothetical protein